MTRDEKRRLLGERQIEIMASMGRSKMFVNYGDDFGEPGYCVTIKAGDEAQTYWFTHAERFSGVDAWLERHATTTDED